MATIIGDRRHDYFVNFLGGLSVLVVAGAANWAWGALSKADLPWWAYLASLAVAMMLGIAVYPRWRNATRTTVVAVWLAVTGLRVTSRRQRAQFVRVGYERRDAEVQAERKVEKRPVWRIDARERLGTTGVYFLENSGYGVFDVSLSCDRDKFELAREMVWPGTFGDDRPGSFIAKPFDGAPTERGRTEGAEFRVEWHDNNGDIHVATVPLTRDEILEGERAIRDEAFAAGVAHGRQQALEVRAPLPLPRPRWRIEAKYGTQHPTWTLHNLVPTSVARNVRVEAKYGARIADAGHWPDLSGGSGGVDGDFKVELLQDGANFGTNFEVSWFDESGTEHSQILEVDP